MRASPIALLLSLALLGAAHAEEQEWVLRIKKEAKEVAITLGATSHYGQRGERIKGSGVVVEKARQVGAFSKVRLDGPVDVRLVAAEQAGVRVRADDNLEALVTSSVEGDTLVIGIKPGSGFSTRNPVKVQIDFKQLQQLQIRGSGDVELDRLTAERLQLELSGSGDLQIGLLELRELQAKLSGSGDLQLAGKVEQQEWELSGSGDVSAASLSGQRVKARLSGSGDMRLGVSQDLDVALSGSGDLSYSGRPVLKSKVSGSGELIQR